MKTALIATAIALFFPFIVAAEQVPPGMPRPPDGRGAFTAVTLRDGKILILGGVVDGQTMQINPVAPTEIYDPKTRKFSRVADMAVPRCHASAILLDDGRVLIVGGSNCVAPFSWRTRITHGFKAAEVFDPRRRTFERVGDMSAGRLFPALVRLKDGTVLVIGGKFNLVCGALKTTELYDPRASAFYPRGSLQSPRIGPDAVLLEDGRIRVSGGSWDRCPPEADGFVEQIEIYDPKTGKFTLGQ